MLSKLLDICDYCGFLTGMTQVGIRELKARLSQYLEMVQNGERILITDHNVIVAELRQPERVQTNRDVEVVLNELESQGKLIKSSGGPIALPSRSGTLKRSDWWTEYEKSKED